MHPAAATFAVGTWYTMSDTQRLVADKRFTNGVGVAFKATGGRRIDFNAGSITSPTGFSLTNKIFQHIINDANTTQGPGNRVRVFDQKAGDSGSCGALGSMSPGKDVRFVTTIGLESTS